MAEEERNRWRRYRECQSALEHVCSALSNQNRVAVICLLAERDVANVEELASELGKRDEFDDSDGSIEVQLQHIHVPKLAEAGFVDYDGRSGAVRATDKIDKIAFVLDCAIDQFEC